jgi:hypothetical protein
MMNYRPYTVITPKYQITSGGIRVMYALRSWLETKGQIVFLNQYPEDKNFIAIYPEIARGNLTQAKHIVRYILNKPGVMTTGGVPGPTEFDDTDMIYVFSQLYNTLGVDEKHIMFLPVLNTHLFKVTNTNKRKLKCKFIGKGADMHLPQTEGLFTLNRPFANDQAGLAEYLNECEVMYSYDNNSAMFEIARLCGCRVVILPSIYSKEEFEKYEPGMNGISYGLHENVALDAAEFRNHYLNMRKVFEERLEEFIDETQ